MTQMQKLFTVDNSIWQEFGIFPEVLNRRADVAKVRADANDQLRKIGIGNLKTLCEELLVPIAPSDSKEEIADKLVGLFPQDLLVHAHEFQKKRAKALQELFEKRYPKPKSISTKVSTFSTNGRETLDNKTRLLLLLNKSESNLRDVFYLSSWLSKDTTYRFKIIDVSVNAISKKIISKIEKLTEMLDVCSDLGGERLGHHELNGQALVIVHLRKYRPRISRDYETTHNLHHICGTLIIGLSYVDGFLHVKSSSKVVADTVERFLVDELQYDVERMEEQIVANFDPKPLSEIIAGKMPAESKFKLKGISLARTNIGGVPLAIARTQFNDSILTTLESLHDAAIVSSATPMCLESLDFDYEGEAIKFHCKTLSGGALRLTYQNAGLTDVFQERLEKDFEKTFATPVNRMLDPSQWALGTTGIIAFILRARTREEIQQYQADVYSKLLELNIVTEQEEVLMLCSRFGSNSSAIPSSSTNSECRECGAPLKSQKITTINVNQRGIRDWIENFIGSGESWEMGARTLTFESQRYYPIYPKNNPTIRIAALFQHRISPEKQLTFDRSSMPIVKFSEYLDVAPLRIERDDSALISLPYLLTTEFEPIEKKKTQEEAYRLFTRVYSTYDSRVSRAARLSADRLEDTSLIKEGAHYEVDVFNVMRWLFWYTSRLGKVGKREPDGIISFQDYRASESATDIKLWNLAYDAKFHSKGEGYDFGPTAQRQAAEYIRKYFRARRNNVKQDRRVLGHAIISNDIDREKISAFVQHLCDEKVITSIEASPVIVLIKDSFFTTLYRYFSNDELNFRKKRLHLPAIVINLLERRTPHMYSEFGIEAAQYIIKEMDHMSPIEDSLDINDLQRTCFSEPPSSIYTPQTSLPTDLPNAPSSTL